MSNQERSINELFEEPFEPLWMKRAREAREQTDDEARRAGDKAYRYLHARESERSLLRKLEDHVDKAWRRQAAESRRRIVANHDAPPIPERPKPLQWPYVRHVVRRRRTD